ncbi:hypothetical protein D9M68_138050 [compost metagenome]
MNRTALEGCALHGIPAPEAATVTHGTTGAYEPAKQPSNRLRVLIVDDNGDAAESRAVMVNEHEVRCFFDGEAALSIT